MLLEDWLYQYRILRESEISPRTEATQEATLRMLADSWGERDITRITPAMADDWAAHLHSLNQSRTTICSHVTRAKLVFARAKRRKLIAENPFDEIPCTPPKPVKQDRRQLTTDEVMRLIGACPDDNWRRLVGLCGLAGLRRGEATRITHECVLRDRRRLVVKPGGAYETTKQRRREVLLVPDLARLLPDGGQGLVVAEQREFSRAIGRIVARSGIGPLPEPFKALRRYRINSWLEQGMQPWVVCEMVGHSAEVERMHYRQVPESVFA